MPTYWKPMERMRFPETHHCAKRGAGTPPEQHGQQLHRIGRTMQGYNETP